MGGSTLKRFRDALIGLLLLAVPFFFLSTHLKHPDKINDFDRMLLRVAEPIRFAAREAATSVSSVLEQYVLLTDVHQENERLVQENSRLRGKIAALAYCR